MNAWVLIPFALVLAALVAERCAVVAMLVARRTGFVDRPLGYKAHAVATPHLGGTAVLTALLVTVLPIAGAGRFATILIGATIL